MASPIKIVGVPVSQNVRKVLAVAYHLDIPIEVAPVPPGDPAARALNPSGRIPAMDDNGFALYESNAIMIYLASKKPSSLYPDDTKKRAKVHQWLFWDAAHWTPAYQPVQFERLVKPRFFGGETDEAVVQRALATFAREAPLLEGALDKQDWVAGASTTLADFGIAAGLTYAKHIDLPLKDYPKIRAWYERVSGVKGWSESAPPF
ncbi:MAG TPA: glutathione S-transferase family protein [Parvularculaceae bacterium]|nr:glutathione S-transferase family protein [Parvularculaceae bacterium]